MNRLIALSVCLCASLAIACSEPNSLPSQPSAATPANGAASSGLTSNGKSGGGPAFLPVLTTVSDGNDISSDGLGSYSNSATLISWLTANGYNGIAYGDWQFSTLSTTARGVKFDFNHPQSQILAPPPAATYPSRIEVECTLIGLNMLAMGPQTTMNCGLISRFPVSSITWRENMNPASLPETTNALITCNSASNVPAGEPAGCTDWFIDPISGGSAVARLIEEQPTHGNNTTAVDAGDYNVSFHFHIQRQ